MGGEHLWQSALKILRDCRLSSGLCHEALARWGPLQQSQRRSGEEDARPEEGRAEPSPALLRRARAHCCYPVPRRCPFGGAGTALTLTAEPSSFSAAWAQRRAAGKLRPGGAPHLLREEEGGQRFCCPPPPAPRPAGLLALPAPPSRGWAGGWRPATTAALRQSSPGLRLRRKPSPGPAAAAPLPLATSGGHDLADRQS